MKSKRRRISEMWSDDPRVDDWKRDENGVFLRDENGKKIPVSFMDDLKELKEKLKKFGAGAKETIVNFLMGTGAEEPIAVTEDEAETLGGQSIDLFKDVIPVTNGSYTAVQAKCMKCGDTFFVGRIPAREWHIAMNSWKPGKTRIRDVFDRKTVDPEFVTRLEKGLCFDCEYEAKYGVKKNKFIKEEDENILEGDELWIPQDQAGVAEKAQELRTVLETAVEHIAALQIYCAENTHDRETLGFVNGLNESIQNAIDLSDGLSKNCECSCGNGEECVCVDGDCQCGGDCSCGDAGCQCGDGEECVCVDGDCQCVPAQTTLDEQPIFLEIG